MTDCYPEVAGRVAISGNWRQFDVALRRVDEPDPGSLPAHPASSKLNASLSNTLAFPKIEEWRRGRRTIYQVPDLTLQKTKNYHLKIFRKIIIIRDNLMIYLRDLFDKINLVI